MATRQPPSFRASVEGDSIVFVKILVTICTVLYALYGPQYLFLGPQRFYFLYSLVTSLHRLTTTFGNTLSTAMVCFVTNGLIFARCYY